MGIFQSGFTFIELKKETAEVAAAHFPVFILESEKLEDKSAVEKPVEIKPIATETNLFGTISEFPDIDETDIPTFQLERFEMKTGSSVVPLGDSEE